MPAPGGKGANQAVAAARAGASVQFIGAVGSDGAAPMLRSHLADNNVGLDGLVEVDGPSGMATITVEDSGENCIVVAPGPIPPSPWTRRCTRTSSARTTCCCASWKFRCEWR